MGSFLAEGFTGVESLSVEVEYLDDLSAPAVTPFFLQKEAH